MARITYWGKSMYGGWYCDIYIDDEPVQCLHFEQYTQLRNFAKSVCAKLNPSFRWDN